MAYATLQNMQDRYSESAVLLVADRNRDGSLDTDAVSKALSDATDEIDSYVAARYNLPLATVPGVIELYCCDIAMYRLADNALVLTEERENRYKAAVSWLTKLAKGIVTLGLDEEPATVTSTVSISSETRRFSRTTMGGL